MLSLLLAASVVSGFSPPEPARLAAFALAESGSAAHLEAAAGVVRLANARSDASLVGDVLDALDQGLIGRTDLAIPDALNAALEEVPESDHHLPVNQVRRLRIRMRTGEPEMRAIARGFLKYDDLHLRELRVELLGVLGELATADGMETLVVLARESVDPAVRRAALFSLQHFEGETAGGRIISFLANSEDQEEAVEILTRRPVWTRHLIQAITLGHAPIEAVLPEHVRRMRLHDDPETAAAVAGMWGGPETELDLLMQEAPRTMKAWESVIGGEPVEIDAIDRGRVVFRNACARCHAGGRFGPPTERLTRSANLPGEIAHPDAYEVNFDWAGWQLVTTDGRRITGSKVEDRPARVTILDSLGYRTSVRREAVESLERVHPSLMPNGLTATLSDQDLHALIAWLIYRPD